MGNTYSVIDIEHILTHMRISSNHTNNNTLTYTNNLYNTLHMIQTLQLKLEIIDSLMNTLSTKCQLFLLKINNLELRIIHSNQLMYPFYNTKEQDLTWDYYDLI